jgi:hypothetical protein
MADNKIYTAEMGQPPQDIDWASVTKADKKAATPPKKMSVPQDVDGASVTRSPKKGEKITYEEPGSGIVIKNAKGGMIGSASSRADGCASKGKTRGKMV